MNSAAGEQVATAVELADRSAGERLRRDRRRLGREDLDRERLGVGRTILVLDLDRERERAGGLGNAIDQSGAPGEIKQLRTTGQASVDDPERGLLVRRCAAGNGDEERELGPDLAGHRTVLGVDRARRGLC